MKEQPEPTQDAEEAPTPMKITVNTADGKSHSVGGQHELTVEAIMVMLKNTEDSIMLKTDTVTGIIPVRHITAVLFS